MKAKQREFFKAWIKTGDPLSAYKATSYMRPNDERNDKSLRAAAYAVMRSKSFKAAIEAHQVEFERKQAEASAMALDWVVSEHRRYMALAEEKGNLAVATKNLEMIGRTRGIYQDTLTLDVGQRQAMSEAQEVEARRLAGLLVAEQVSGTVVCVDAGNIDTGESGASGVEPIECEVVEVLPEVCDANDCE